jgi:hypothetical protein
VSPKHARVFVAVISAILSGVATPAGAQPLNSKIEVECDAFQKNQNGSWTLNHETVVNHDIYGQVLTPGTFRKNDVNVFGFDLIRVLEQVCSASSDKK